MSFAKIAIATAGVLCGVALMYILSQPLLWLLSAIGTFLFWSVIILIALNVVLMIGYWLWPGDLDIAYIGDEEPA